MPPWIYMTTAQAFDDAMRDRIAVHRRRRSTGWIAVDAPLDVAESMRAAPRDAAVLIDCLTLWRTNLMLAETHRARGTAPASWTGALPRARAGSC